MMSEVLERPGGKSPSADPRTSPHLPSYASVLLLPFQVTILPRWLTSLVPVAVRPARPVSLVEPPEFVHRDLLRLVPCALPFLLFFHITFLLIIILVTKTKPIVVIVVLVIIKTKITVFA